MSRDSGRKRVRKATVTETNPLDADTGVLTSVSRTGAAAPVTVQSVHGLPVAQTSLDGSTRTCYDAFGRVAAVAAMDAGGATNRVERIGYDVSGNAVRRVVDFLDGRTAESTAEFDALNMEARRTDALGNVVETCFDPLGRTVFIGGDACPTRSAYDTQGRRVSLSTTRDGGGTWDETRWEFDPASGANTAKTYADGSRVAYACTDDGRRTRTAWARGAWRESSYSPRNLVSATFHSGADTPSVSYGYDAAGSLASATLSDGTAYSYAYDDRLLNTNEVVTVCGGTFAIHRTYDGFRRSLVTGVSDAVDGVGIGSLSYAYDALGRPISRSGDAFAYNERGEVIFSRRAAGNAEDSYGYDDIGNLLHSASGFATNAYAANSLNQYTSLCASASPCETIPHYDSDGSMTQFGTWTYAYDSANRLSTVSSNGVVLVANSYDAKGRRVRKATQNAATTFFYDDWNLLEERIVRTDATASTIHYYWGKDVSGTLHGAGGVGGLLYLTVDGVPYVPTYDANGNVTRYIDANGGTVAQYAYDAFGRTISQTGPLAGFFRHRFSTKYLDSETGIYHYGYRFYSPNLMRWLNRDPIEEDGGENLYAFCGNNALCFIDPFGNDRYMTTFSIDPEKDQWHVGVAVDTWKCRNGRWQKTGIVTFEFLVDDSSWWKRAGRFVAVAKGIIVSRSGLSLVEPFALHSTPEQDIAMLNQMKSGQKNPPLYNAFFNNCIHWATKAIDYGMDR